MTNTHLVEDVGIVVLPRQALDPECKRIAMLTVLLKRFVHFHLDYLLRLHKRVHAGAVLSDKDLRFLKDLLLEAKRYQRYIDEDPAWQGLFLKVTMLYRDIIQQDLLNEQARQLQKD